MPENTVKTSLSNPLRIDGVAIPGTEGLIGLTFCPGKKGKSIFGGVWDRDLECDLAVIEAWGAEVLVSLMEDHEFELLKVSHFREVVSSRAFGWRHMPITDGNAPDDRFEDKWCSYGPELIGVLRRGGRIVVHCRGGLGRAGTVAARLLIECGVSPVEAIRHVRQARRGAIETREQEEYLLRL